MREGGWTRSDVDAQMEVKVSGRGQGGWMREGGARSDIDVQAEVTILNNYILRVTVDN